MYPKRDYFSFISTETTHNIDGITHGERNNTAADKVASLLMFHCILECQI